MLSSHDRVLFAAAALIWLLMTAWKAVLAANVGVVWEEAHFVVAGMHPALAYPDIPAGWPLFARACIALFGWSPLAIRLPALAVTQTLPFAIYFLAEPVAGRRNGAWAAVISMIMPPLAASGVIFYSEAAMQILLALMLGGLIRAQRSGLPRWWVLDRRCGGDGPLHPLPFRHRRPWDPGLCAYDARRARALAQARVLGRSRTGWSRSCAVRRLQHR